MMDFQLPSRRLSPLCFAAAALAPATALAQSGGDSGKWEFSGTIYGFLPTLGVAPLSIGFIAF